MNSTLERSAPASSVLLAQHHGDHRRHGGEPGAAVASDRLDIGAGGELRQQHDGGVRRAGELGQRQRVHVIERRRDQVAVAVEILARAASPPPRGGSGARARRPSGFRSSPTCRGTSPARARPARPASNGPGSRKASKRSLSSPPKHTTGSPGGQSARRGEVAEHELRSGIAQDEMDGLARKLEVHRHRDEAGAHDAVIGGDVFGAIGRQDGDAVAAREAARGERTRDAIRHPVEPARS